MLDNTVCVMSWHLVRRTYCIYKLLNHSTSFRNSAIDPTIEEAVASVIWAEPRLSSEIPELLIVSIPCYMHI